MACATSARAMVRPAVGLPPTTRRYTPVSGLSVSLGGRTDVQSVALAANAASIARRSTYTSFRIVPIMDRMPRSSSPSPGASGPTGAALTTTMRRAPSASIAASTARVRGS